jgi:pimeloyl-ACP methyl ester carboxylesterase
MLDPAVRLPMIAWMIEGARQGLAGFVSDWVAEYRPWGFSLRHVAQHVEVWWGEQDHFTSRVHAGSLAAMLPDARLTLYPNDGHNAPIVHWAEMLAALA